MVMIYLPAVSAGARAAADGTSAVLVFDHLLIRLQRQLVKALEGVLSTSGLAAASAPSLLLGAVMRAIDCLSATMGGLGTADDALTLLTWIVAPVARTSLAVVRAVLSSDVLRNEFRLTEFARLGWMPNVIPPVSHVSDHALAAVRMQPVAAFGGCGKALSRLQLATANAFPEGGGRFHPTTLPGIFTSERYANTGLTRPVLLRVP